MQNKFGQLTQSIHQGPSRNNDNGIPSTSPRNGISMGGGTADKLHEPRMAELADVDQLIPDAPHGLQLNEQQLTSSQDEAMG